MKHRLSSVVLDSPIAIDEFGMLTARAKIARIGIQKYFIDGKLYRELRSVEEVKKSVDSFNNKPVTLNHPLSRKVDAKNARHEMKGFMRDVEYNDQDGWVYATVIITHEDAVLAAQSSHDKLSNGYFSKVLDFSEPQIWIDELGVMGEKGKSYEYDSMQTEIRGNHVALVKTARAGEDATFVTDSADADDIITIRTVNDSINNDMEEDIKTPEMEKNDTKSIMIGDKSYSISGSDAQALIDTVNEMMGKMDAMSVKQDELDAEIVNLKSSRMDSNEVAEEVKARTEIWSRVAQHVDSEIDYGLSVVEVQKLYLKKAVPQLATKIDSASDAYIQGIWDLKQPEVEVKADAEDLNNEVLDQVKDLDANADKKVVTPKNDSSDLDKLQAEYEASRAKFYG